MGVTIQLEIRLPSNVFYLFLLAPFFIFVNEAGETAETSLSFIEEPPRRVSFLNSVGAVIKCSSSSGVKTSSTPTVTWHLKDGELVRDLLNLRYTKNGSLVFTPFTPDKYRHDVHSAAYRCRSTGSEGTIVSRPVKVKAVVRQPYQARVYDEYVIEGNTGVLKCQLPGYVSDEVIVTGWVREDNFVVDGNENGFKGKYTAFPDGHLHINNVEASDAHFSYWCRTKYRTDDEGIFQLSETSGRLQVADDAGNSVSPRITHIRQTVTAISGQNAVFLPCAGQGYPVPSFRWTNTTSNLQTINFNRRISVKSGTLIINSVNSKDSGLYSCEIYNNVGSDLKTTRLIVREPLRAVIERNSQRVLPGNRLILKCSATGSPIDSFEWFKDGRKLDFNDGRLHQQRNSSNSIHVDIKSVKRRDDGLYQCFVSNSWETSHAVVTVTFSSILPEIVSRFEGRTLQPGPTVKLKCTASGKPTPEIQWKLDNIDISSESLGPDRKIHKKHTKSDGLVSSELVIKSIRVEDGGEYRCTASNKIGSVTHKSRINVYGLPHVRQMKNVKVTAGEDVNVTCYATGYPIHHVYWTKGNEKINGRILSLTNVRKKHTNILYSCVAVGSGGKQSKQDLMLSVLENPEIGPMGFPEDVTNGRALSIFCTVISGDKPVSILWMKDGNPIKHHFGIMTTKSSDYAKLHINEANTKHSGVYTCVATNEAGTVNKSTILTVKASPTWTEKPRNTTVLENRTVYVHCRGDSNPKASINWKKFSGDTFVDAESMDNRYSVLEKGTLRILETRKADSGLYKCTISNGIYPDLSQAVSLSIGSPPVVNSIGDRKELNMGDTLKINCRTSSVEDSTKVSWFRDNDFIKDSRFIKSQKSTDFETDFTLKLPSIKEEDAGVYGCVVSNDFGETSSKVAVSINNSNFHRENIEMTTQRSNSKPTPVTTSIVNLAEITESQQNGTETTGIHETTYVPTIKVDDPITPGVSEKSESATGGFRWRKYMLYYVVPAGIIILVLIIALAIVLCLLCCSKNQHRPQQTQVELQHKQADNYRVAKSVDYNNETLLNSRYGKVGGCRDRRPLSGSFPNLPAGDKHYLGFSPYGTLEHQTSHYTPAPS